MKVSRKQFGMNGVGLCIKERLDVPYVQYLSLTVSNQSCCYISSELRWSVVVLLLTWLWKRSRNPMIPSFYQ